MDNEPQGPIDPAIRQARLRWLARRQPIAFALLAGGLVLLGSLYLIAASRATAAERTVAASIVTSGCEVAVRPVAGGPVTAFHVDLCPFIPVGTGVSVVYDGGRPVELVVGNAVIDVATSRASNDRTRGVLLLVFGGFMLLFVGIAVTPGLRGLPRPTPKWFAVLLLEVAIPMALGLIAALQPLHEDAVDELKGAAVGAAIGLGIACCTAIALRRRVFGESTASELPTH